MISPKKGVLPRVVNSKPWNFDKLLGFHKLDQPFGGESILMIACDERKHADLRFLDSVLGAGRSRDSDSAKNPLEHLMMRTMDNRTKEKNEFDNFDGFKFQIFNFHVVPESTGNK